MKTIGLLGGMSWESTVNYYRLINQGVNKQLGGLHSAKIVMYSIDFDQIEMLQHQGDWKGAAEILIDGAKRIESAGADFIIICTNTMHKVASKITNAINIPLLHIADATADSLLENSIKRVGLLGTSFTMEEDFYTGKLSKNYALEVITPDKPDREIIHNIIYQELCLGQILEASKTEYLKIMNKLAEQGAQAIILGCTEIGMLIKQTDTTIPLFDTTVIHAQKAIAKALSI